MQSIASASRVDPRRAPAPIIRLVTNEAPAGNGVLSYASVLAALDALGEPAAFYSLNGSLIAQTTSLERLIAAEGAPLAGAIRSVVLRAADLRLTMGHPTVVRARMAAHLIEGSLCEGQPHPSVMISVSPGNPMPEQLTEKELRARYKLTPMELRVAMLLAEHKPNRDVAVALGVSEHTARHHTERVFRKIGVKRRVEVAQKLAR